MSAPPRHEPVRTCIGCRTRHPHGELVRVTRAADGTFVAGGVSAGRGAWLCRATGLGDAGAGDTVERSCLERALRTRAFARAWRVELGADDERRLRELLEPRDADWRPDEGLTTGKG